MASGTNQEVTSIELVETRTRDQNPNQRRAFNYVFKVTTQDADTGDTILQGEYRTYASSREMLEETVKQKMIDLLEQL